VGCCPLHCTVPGPRAQRIADGPTPSRRKAVDRGQRMSPIAYEGAGMKPRTGFDTLGRSARGAGQARTSFGYAVPQGWCPAENIRLLFSNSSASLPRLPWQSTQGSLRARRTTLPLVGSRLEILQ